MLTNLENSFLLERYKGTPRVVSFKFKNNIALRMVAIKELLKSFSHVCMLV